MDAHNGQFYAGMGDTPEHGGINPGGLATYDTDAVSRRQNRGVIPRFFTIQKKKSDGSGYIEQEFVELLIPGDAKSAPVHLVDDRHREMFHDNYRAFKENRELPTDGTAVEYWLGAGDPMVLLLKSLHLRTVEAVSQMSDTVCQTIGMGGRELRERARKFLSVQGDSAAADKLAAKDDLIADLQRRLKALEEGKKPDAFPSVEEVEAMNVGALRKLCSDKGIDEKKLKNRDELLHAIEEARGA